MITFIINYHGEPVSAVEVRVAKLKEFYGADVRVFILGDGVAYQGPSESMAFPCMKLPENGGAWTHRYLKFFLEHSSAPYLIKIDPDTQVLAQANDLPDTDCVFCRVREVLHGRILFRFPAGGALGFTRGMAETLVAGEYFLQDRYKSDVRYGNYNDLMLRDIVQRNGLNLVDRPDFCCGGRPLHSGASFHHK